MPDDVLIQPASGVGAVPVAADEIAGSDGVLRKHQRVKVQHGANDSATDVSTASPLPVAQQGAVILPTGASSSAKQDLAQARFDLLATEAKLEQVRALLAGTLAVNSELPAAAVLADGTANPTLPGVDAYPELYNGATWDRQRGNTEGTLLASAARTAQADTAIQTNHNARGVVVYFYVTVVGTGNLSVRVLGVDPVASAWTSLWMPAGVTVVGMYRYAMYPGASTTGTTFTGMVSSPLPRRWILQIVPSDASSWTYSVGHSLSV